MKLANNITLEDNEYISQVAFYLKDKLIKVKRFEDRFNVLDLDLKIPSDKVVCFIENAEKTAMHKVTLEL